MELIDVIEVDVYRDGGTTVYHDRLNRKYYTYPTLRGKVYNDFPQRMGSPSMPHPSALEIPVTLNIVDSFD